MATVITYTNYVLDTNNKPVVGASVVLSDYVTGLQVATATSDATGRWSVNVAVGRYSMVATLAGVVVQTNPDLQIFQNVATGDVTVPTLAALAASTGSSLVGFTQAGTGAVARTVQAKTRESVSATDFAGVDPTGATDSTAGLRNAVARIASGGILFIPAGTYMLSDEITLAAGVTVIGASAADFAFGSPPSSSSVPTYLYQTTNNKSIFVITGGMHNVTVGNLALSSRAVPLTTGFADVTGKYGIRLQDSYPNFIWTLTFSNITFYNLERGISVSDPHAGTNMAPYNFDWSVAPVSVRDCRFLYTQNGVYVNTNNADYWVYERCQFAPASGGGVGINLYRAGLQFVVRSFFGGAAINSNTGIYVLGNGGVNNDGNGIDDIVLEHCQAETLTHFLLVDSRTATNSYTTTPTIVCKSGHAELGADITLLNRCHFVGENNKFIIPMYVNSTSAGTGTIKISSINDYYDPGLPSRWYILAGDERDYLQTIKLGAFPPSGPPIFANAALIENGKVWKYDGAAPIVGQWYRNDRIINNAPTVGQPKAWVNTVSGTPGTWVSEGNL